MTRKILVITGSRAEFGLLKCLMSNIDKDSNFELQIIATGTHLSPKHGLTVIEIEEAGFLINAKLDLNLVDDSNKTISQAIALGMTGFTDEFKKLNPDLIIVLGDRFELLPAAISALISRIPLAHIHGGETTEGAYDEAIRHSITKMSHLHFVGNDEYAKRVIQLGEHPDRVFTVGGLGVDAIKQTKLLTKKELEKSMNFEFGDKNLLVTYHPETLNYNNENYEILELINALKQLQNTQIIFTMPNADSGSKRLFEIINEFINENSHVYGYESLGQVKYLSCISFVDGVLGNSSSGLAEVPSMQKGTINIGDRQKGRLIADSVINCRPIKNEILSAIKRLYSEEFQSLLPQTKNPYGDGGASKKIVAAIKDINLKGIIKKSFYDLPYSQLS